MTDPTESNSQPEEQPDNPIAEAVNEHAERTAPGERRNLHFPATGQGEMEAASERKWASMGHILSLFGIPIVGFGYVIAPLVIFLMKKGQSPFLDEHVKETLNFSIISAIAIWVSGLTAVASAPVLGCFAPLIPGVFAVMNLIFCIQGFIASKNGEAYRYPLNIRMIR